MEEQLAHFTEQFDWEPEVLHADRLPGTFSEVIVAGMGGSHLGARLLLRHDPTLPITIHSDYGLPRIPETRLKTALIIASSYSGETEETIDAAKSAVSAGLSVAVVTTGGVLADFAREHDLPLIILPHLSVEPRMAAGASMLAIARLMGDSALENAVRAAGKALDPERTHADASALAETLSGATPVIYTSTLNLPLAYFWKIALNETGKIPAFYNVFPELCHNELSGYDTTPTSQDQTERLHAILLTDSDDHPRVSARMRILQDLLADRKTATTSIALVGETPLEKALYGVLTGVWFALVVAKKYGAPDAATPLIAEFKQKMADL